MSSAGRSGQRVWRERVFFKGKYTSRLSLILEIMEVPTWKALWTADRRSLTDCFHPNCFKLLLVESIDRKTHWVHVIGA